VCPRIRIDQRLSAHIDFGLCSLLGASGILESDSPTRIDTLEYRGAVRTVNGKQQE
jgi:hypothetical protein